MLIRNLSQVSSTELKNKKIYNTGGIQMNCSYNKVQNCNNTSDKIVQVPVSVIIVQVRITEVRFRKIHRTESRNDIFAELKRQKRETQQRQCWRFSHMCPVAACRHCRRPVPAAVRTLQAQGAPAAVGARRVGNPSRDPENGEEVGGRPVWRSVDG